MLECLNTQTTKNRVSGIHNYVTYVITILALRLRGVHLQTLQLQRCFYNLISYIFLSTNKTVLFFCHGCSQYIISELRKSLCLILYCLRFLFTLEGRFLSSINYMQIHMFVHLYGLQRLHLFFLVESSQEEGITFSLLNSSFKRQWSWTLAQKVVYCLSFHQFSWRNPIQLSPRNHVGWRRTGTFFWSSSCQLVQFLCNKEVVKRHLCLLLVSFFLSSSLWLSASCRVECLSAVLVLCGIYEISHRPQKVLLHKQDHALKGWLEDATKMVKR